MHPKPKNRDRLCFEPRRRLRTSEECQKEGLQQFIQLPVSGSHNRNKFLVVRVRFLPTPAAPKSQGIPCLFTRRRVGGDPSYSMVFDANFRFRLRRDALRRCQAAGRAWMDCDGAPVGGARRPKLPAYPRCIGCAAIAGKTSAEASTCWLRGEAVVRRCSWH